MVSAPGAVGAAGRGAEGFAGFWEGLPRKGGLLLGGHLREGPACTLLLPAWFSRGSGLAADRQRDKVWLMAVHGTRRSSEIVELGRRSPRSCCCVAVLLVLAFSRKSSYKSWSEVQDCPCKGLFWCCGGELGAGWVMESLSPRGGRRGWKRHGRAPGARSVPSSQVLCSEG